VSVSDVANAAELSEQTVYNYFPTKERLVLDRDDELRDRLTHLIRSRPPGISAAAAIREEALDFTESIRSIPADQIPGGRRSLQGQRPAQIADEVRPIVADIIDELDRWLTAWP
jgi:AcrR family transcriptional regulator